MDAVTVNKGEMYTLPTCDFTAPAGKEFNGWNLGAAGVQVEITADTELVAQWKDESEIFKVTFKANGGKGKMVAQTGEKGKKIKLNANKFKRAGYVFAGWNTKKDGKGTAYKGSATITLTKNITLYAQWDKITLTIKSISKISRSKILTISATLKIGGKVVKGKTLTFVYKGKKRHTFKAKTNGQGIAKVKIPKKYIQELKVGKTATITVSYGGATVKKNAKIAK